ncbi:AAA family ATPase [Clostridium celatum]|uniref:AAA family ATPase n=1 Tax=Clostridium celatum TaxID=36834 RepID=UPI000A07142D
MIKVADPTIKKLNVIFNENEASISVEAIHNIYKNNEVVGEIKVPFFEEQSHGTINIFELLPLVFKVLDEGGILVVDEIENVIHPNLLKAIIDKFYNKESNPLNAQLICTTHNTNLIEKDIRRDEIWLVDRDSYGQSYLNRLSDKKVRQTESYSQKYLSGIFGGVPEI